MKYVFIGGCDRSGTTMIGSMLGGIKNSVCLPESQFIVEIFLKHNLLQNKKIGALPLLL